MTKVITYETVSVHKATKKRLVSFGRMGQTYDEVMNEVLDIAERERQHNHQNRRQSAARPMKGSEVGC